MPRVTRRTHTKSRNGCIECKNRHIRCDERRPVCSHCISGGRSCDFMIHERLARVSRSTSRDTVAASSDVSSPGQPPDILSHVFPVNMLHVRLLYHVISGATMSPGESGAISGISTTDILRFSTSAPYLVNQILAHAALHLSVIKPQSRSFYHSHAAHLQAHALNDFTGQQHDINEESSVPIFLFVKLLGVDMLCDTLAFCEDPFEMFMHRFGCCIGLHQGMRTSSAKGSLEIIRQAAMHASLRQDNQVSISQADTEFTQVCQMLSDRIKASENSHSQKKTYETAILALQSVMTALASHDSKSRAADVLSMWPMLLPRGYVDLLSARKGESLVILAHYGALLHLQRDQWMFGDGGRILVESIQRYLGTGWTDWLKWPLEILMKTRNQPMAISKA